MDVQLPDGTIIQGVPDGMSRADLVTKLKANGHDVSGLEAAPAPKQAGVSSSPIMDMPLAAGITPRSALGVLRGGKDIIDTGARLAAKGYDKVTGSNEAARVDEMNKAGEADYQGLVGGNPDKVSRVVGQGLATAPIGGVLGQGARLLGAAPKVVSALASNGFSTGAPAAATLAGRAGDLALRSGAGAVTGGATVGLIDPEHAGTGAIVGGLLPPAVKGAAAAGSLMAESATQYAKTLMQQAVKPTQAELRSGEAATAIQTLLDYGISPNMKGVNKLRDLISGLNERVSNAIGSSTATIDKSKVAGALADTRARVRNQVSPQNDLAAISGIEQDFMGHPDFPGQTLPVQAAQDLKQGTYRNLAGKFGEQGSASTEAQKGLARGLKNEIAAAVPEVGPLNAEESRLLTTLDVAERRALLELNKNPTGLAALAKNKLAALAFMADRSSDFKALAARMINYAASPGSRSSAQGLLDRSANPLLRSTTPALSNQGSPQ